jgi:hypothetical protein
VRFYQLLLNGIKHEDIGPAVKLYRQLLPDGDLVALHADALHAVEAVVGATKERLYREETWLYQKRFELQQNLIGTYPAVSIL